MLAATSSDALSPPALYSAQDLCRAVRAASAEAWRAGSRGLDRVLHHDADRALLEVQASVPWDTLSRFRGTDGLRGYRFDDDASCGTALLTVELFPRGVVVAVD